MNDQVTPYDTGTRLEPKPWVSGGIAGSDTPRAAAPGDYGRVDFDDDEGNTMLTVWAQKTVDGIILRVNAVSEAPFEVETSEDLAQRQTYVERLHDALEELSNEANGNLSWDDEGDPSAFSPGHYCLSSIDPEGDEFYVELTYSGTNPYEDSEAVPTGLKWHTRARQYDAHGSYRTFASPTYTAVIEEGEVALNAAREWAVGIAGQGGPHDNRQHFSQHQSHHPDANSRARLNP